MNQSLFVCSRLSLFPEKIYYQELQIERMQQDKDDIDLEEFEVLPELNEEESRKIEQEYIDGLNKFYSDSKKYSIEYWYEQLKQFTFQSYWFQLTNLDAYLLNLIYHESKDKLETQVMINGRDLLVKKVDKFLKQRFPKGCFLKLSTRSPKDYSWRYDDKKSNQKDIDRLFQKLSGLKLPFGHQLINQMYRYFLEQSKTKIKIMNGEQFVDIFSHSERIQIDIGDLMYLNHKVNREFDSADFSRGNQILLKVWGREWVDCEWMEEFRCFFHEYRLTGITQYDQRCYFHQIEGKSEIIKQKVCQFFEVLRPKLSQIDLSSGVMDIIVRFRDEVITLQLIEINVFNSNSRGSLFSWKNDRTLLEEGPLEIRYHKAPIEITKWELIKMMGMIERGIQGIVQNVMNKLGYNQQWNHKK